MLYHYYYYYYYCGLLPPLQCQNRGVSSRPIDHPDRWWVPAPPLLLTRPSSRPVLSMTLPGGGGPHPAMAIVWAPLPLIS